MGRLAQTLGVTNKRLFTTTTAETNAQTLVGEILSGSVQIYSTLLLPRPISKDEYIVSCRIILYSFTSSHQLQHELWGYFLNWNITLLRTRWEVTNCHQCCFSKSHVYFKVNEASCWWALRASVLRRAVSQSTRPAMHRAIVRSFRAARTRCASWQDLRSWSENNLIVPRPKCSAPKGQAVTPNHSLNRTHCGVPSFGL